MKYIYISLAILFGFYILSYLLRIYLVFSKKKEA